MTAGLYSRVVRPSMRKIIAAAAPGPYRAKRRVAVIGLPRSGTSWLAKALSLSDGVSYYFEPDQQLDDGYMYRYVPPTSSEPKLRAHVRQAFAGKYTDDYTIGEQGIGDLLTHAWSHTVIVKWVRLCFCAEWIGVNFPEINTIHIIRHPVPLFLSWRARGWDAAHNLGVILKQRELMSGPLARFAPVMQAADTYWRQAAALWGAATYMQLRARPTGYVVEHEWFCQDAGSRIRWLAGEFGLEWNSGIDEFLAGRIEGGFGPGYGKPRDPRSEIHKWKGEVAAADLREIEQTLAPFELPFYPGLDPEAVHGPDRGLRSGQR